MSALQMLNTATADRRSAGPAPSPGISRCWFSEDACIEQLDFGLADRTELFEQAFALVHDQYVASGYMARHPRGWRLSLYNALPSTKVFVARQGDRVVGALTCIPDSPLGLPMDEIYRGETDVLRAAGRRLAEVSALAIDPAWRSMGVAVMMRLVRMIVIYAAEIACLDDIVIAVNPSHAAFYRRGLHFRSIGGLKEYEKVNGAPAVGLRFELSLARALIRELREGHPICREMYRFVFGPEACADAIAALLEALPRSSLTRGQFAHFFGDHDLLQRATPENRRLVESFYDCEDQDLASLARTLVCSLGEFLNPPSRVPSLT